MLLLILPYEFAYLIGCSFLFVLWAGIFLKRKDLRREMILASFLGLPLGIVDYFLNPYYWHPDSIFDLMPRFGIGVESFLFFFLMAGLAAVTYEVVTGAKVKKITRNNGIHLLPIIIAPLLFLFLAVLFPTKAIYSFSFCMAVGASLAIFLRQDLLKQALWSAFVFAVCYLLGLALMIFLFPGLVERFYNLPNLIGVFVSGVPIEEIITAFFAGAFWSIIYEYVKGYRV